MGGTPGELRAEWLRLLSSEANFHPRSSGVWREEQEGSEEREPLRETWRR